MARLQEVGQILEKAQNTAAWVKKPEEYALKEPLSGKETI